MSTDDTVNGGAGEDTVEDSSLSSTQTSQKKTLAELIKDTPGLQDELNKMMADNRRKITKQNEDLMRELNIVKERFTGTAQEKQQLESRIEELQNQFLSKEELAKREAEKARKEHQKTLETAKQESEAWKNRYTESRIQRELLDAAIGAKAINPEIIVDMLSNKTYLASKLDNGTPTGDYEVRVKFPDVDEEKNPVTLELSPEATLKRMQDLIDKYGNLFQSTATSGVGASSGMGGSQKLAPSMSAILDDQEAFMKWRKEHPDLDITKLRR